MARRARSKPTPEPRSTAPRARAVEVVSRFPLPDKWRTSTWQVPAMMAKIRPENYEQTAREFEEHYRARGTLSDDWRMLWRDWCWGARKRVDQPVVGLFE